MTKNTTRHSKKMNKTRRHEYLKIVWIVRKICQFLKNNKTRIDTKKYTSWYKKYTNTTWRHELLDLHQTITAILEIFILINFLLLFFSFPFSKFLSLLYWQCYPNVMTKMAWSRARTLNRPMTSSWHRLPLDAWLEIKGLLSFMHFSMVENH